MLTTPSHLVCHTFENGFQDSLFHHLPRDQSEAGGPIGPQIVLLTIPKDRKGFSSFNTPESLPIALTF